MYANGESDIAQGERFESVQHALCVGFPHSATAHMVFVPVTLQSGGNGGMAREGLVGGASGEKLPKKRGVARG